jgi:hypothetical protein
LVGNLERRRRLRRSSARWEDNNEWDVRFVEWEDADWIHLAQINKQ